MLSRTITVPGANIALIAIVLLCLPVNGQDQNACELDPPFYTIIDLGDLVDRTQFPTLEPQRSRAWSINNNNEITGEAQIDDGFYKAFLYLTNGAAYGLPAINAQTGTPMHNLGTLATGNAARVWGALSMTMESSSAGHGTTLPAIPGTR